jgi:hypothetical protein
MWSHILATIEEKSPTAVNFQNIVTLTLIWGYGCHRPSSISSYCNYQSSKSLILEENEVTMTLDSHKTKYTKISD